MIARELNRIRARSISASPRPCTGDESARALISACRRRRRSGRRLGDAMNGVRNDGPDLAARAVAIGRREDCG